MPVSPAVNVAQIASPIRSLPSIEACVVFARAPTLQVPTEERVRQIAQGTKRRKTSSYPTELVSLPKEVFPKRESMEERFSPTIPVLGKSPQPDGYCYPLGSAEISEALAGLRIFDRLTMRFSTRTPILTEHPPQKTVPLVRITYTNYPAYAAKNAPSEKPLQGGEKWAIEVLPVPYEHRDFLKQRIIERVLPDLRDWLSGPPPQGLRRLTRMFWYDVALNRVEWIEGAEEALP